MPWPDHDGRPAERSGRAAGIRERSRAGIRALAAGGALAVGLTWLAPAATAQSPFSPQPPSRSGAFTLPRPSGDQSPFSRTPARGGTVTIPTPRPGPPAGRVPMTVPPNTPGSRPPGPLRPLPDETAPTLPEALPVPSQAPSSGVSPTVEELPPAPKVAPPLSDAPTGPVPRAEPVLLRSGMTVTLRVCQLIHADCLSSGERLLNSRPAVQPGDRFLAELIDPPSPYPVLVGGTIESVTRPGRFGKPGYVALRMVQLVQFGDGRAGVVPWRMDLADRRFATKMRRVLLTTLLSLEGAGTGASIGAQFSGGNMAFIGGGMGIGALVGMGYASFQRGIEAFFEPGDMYEIVVGSTESRPVPREWQTVLYPASEARDGKAKHR